jgi:hypothetical protein
LDGTAIAWDILIKFIFYFFFFLGEEAEMKTVIKMAIVGVLFGGLVTAACGGKEKVETVAQKSERYAKACNSYVRCIQGDDGGWLFTNVSGCIYSVSRYNDHTGDTSWGLRQNGMGAQLVLSALLANTDCLAEADADCEKAKSCVLKEHTGEPCPEYTEYGAENVHCSDGKTITGCVSDSEQAYDVMVDCGGLGLSCVDVTVGGIRTVGCGEKTSKSSDTVSATCEGDVTVIQIGNAVFRLNCRLLDELSGCNPGTYSDVSAFEASAPCKQSEEPPACDLNGNQNHCEGNVGINCYGSSDDAQEHRIDCEKLGMVCVQRTEDNWTDALCAFTTDCDPNTIDETCNNGTFEYCGLTGKASLPCN